MGDGLGTVRWFGEDWGAPVCDPRTHVPTPVGAPCAGHDHLHNLGRTVAIKAGDQGVLIPYLDGGGLGQVIAYHLTCWLHEVGADRITNTERNT
jgi:hypothetical protein